MAKQTISMYECPKCNKTVYFRSGVDEVYTKCKTCGTELTYRYTNPYHPNKNIKMVNNINTNSYPKNPASTQPTNVPKCPTCQSTNIRKMGSVERGASILTWGIFSKKINKTFKCNNCGHTW